MQSYTFTEGPLLDPEETTACPLNLDPKPTQLQPVVILEEDQEEETPIVPVLVRHNASPPITPSESV